MVRQKQEIKQEHYFPQPQQCDCSFPISSCFKFLTVFRDTDIRLSTRRKDELERNEKSSFFRDVIALYARLRLTRLGN